MFFSIFDNTSSKFGSTVWRIEQKKHTTTKIIFLVYYLAFWGLSALKKCHIGLHLSAFKWQFGPLWE